MKNKYIKDELKREVELLMPENMLDDIKAKNVVPKRVENKNIAVINEHKKNRSIVPIIASCVASIVLCVAIFLPIALKSKEEYKDWLAGKQQGTQIEEQAPETQEEQTQEQNR